MRQKAFFLRVVYALLVVLPAAAQPARTLLLQPGRRARTGRGPLAAVGPQERTRRGGGVAATGARACTAQGFVLASVDSLHAAGDTTVAWLYVG
jgi:hypothetical protein